MGRESATDAITQDKREKTARLLLCALLVFVEVETAFNLTVREIISNTYGIDAAICYGILLIIAAKAVPYVFTSLKKIEWLFVLIYTGVTLVSVYTSKVAGIETDELVRIFVHCLPMFLVATSIKDYDKLKDSLRICGYILIFCVAWLLLVLDYYSISEETHSLTGAYSAATAILLLMCCKKRKLDILFAIAGGFLLVTLGARGPFIIVIVAIAFYLLFGIKSKYKAIYFILILLAGLMIYMNYYSIIDSLKSLMQEFGFSTRLLDKAASSELYTDTAREKIYEDAWEYIRDHVFTGAGLGNDRVVLGVYPHNFFLELMMQFGMVWGVIGTAAILLSIIMLLFRDRSEYRMLDFVIVAIGIMPLMISFSYVSYVNLFLLFGYIVSKYRSRKRLGNHSGD